MGKIYCFAKEGGYKGEMKRLGGADIKDPEAIGEAAAQLAHLVGSEIEKPVNGFLAADRAQAEADRAHNDALLVQAGHEPINKPRLPKPETPEGTAHARERRPSLSRTLAQDQFAPPPDRFALAQNTAGNIAAAAVQQAERKVLDRQIRADGERLTSEDIAAATERETPEREPDQPFSSDEISNLLRD